MSDTLINVEGVSKKFCRSLKKSLWYGVQDLTNEIRGRRHGGNGDLRPDEFWAVRDVSFELKRGECLGLIGPNGAGKSTLLKILNGLIKPDHGQITMRGRISALIALGAGFNPILTGRENIYINGSILGFNKTAIDRKLDEIIDFAELEDFIDMPVQNYSSGMAVRLGFAVAAQMEPDILILDEVLAVGDAGFRHKSFNTIMDIMQQAAVVFVSHSMPQIGRISSQVMVLESGAPKLLTNEIGKGIEAYYETVTRTDLKRQTTGSGRIRLQDLRLENNAAIPVRKIEFSQPFSFVCVLLVDAGVSDYGVRFNVRSREQQFVAQFSSGHDEQRIQHTGEITVRVDVDSMRLNPGLYVAGMFVYDNLTNEVLMSATEWLEFEVTGNVISAAPVVLGGRWTVLAASEASQLP